MIFIAQRVRTLCSTTLFLLHSACYLAALHIWTLAKIMMSHHGSRTCLPGRVWPVHGGHLRSPIKKICNQIAWNPAHKTLLFIIVWKFVTTVDVQLFVGTLDKMQPGNVTSGIGMHHY